VLYGDCLYNSTVSDSVQYCTVQNSTVSVWLWEAQNPLAIVGFLFRDEAETLLLQHN